ncbi:MAG: ferritin-like domain-containing protein [Myxococcales bacterium]|nr:ferritin-like domain-containing protein [Myxococcales bacterium]
MKTRRPLPALRLSLLAALGVNAACDDTPADPDAGIPEAGTPEAGLDAMLDAALDAMLDATPDGQPADRGPDASPDASPDAGPTPTDCIDPQPVLDPTGAPTGVVRCADGSMNRVEAIACEPTVAYPACSGAGNEGDCQQDTDCGDRPHGRCVVLPLGGGIEFCGCRYGCATDDDCGDGQVCICPGVIDGNSYCTPAGCETGADCNSGECAVNSTSDGCYNHPEVACREPAIDMCRTNQDCQDDGAGDGCTLSAEGNWMCTFLPVCGRPLTVDGHARTADATDRSDWIEHDIGRPAMASLAAAERVALAAWWQGIAALEHASVASFARTTLQLLALGAPAELVLDTQRAAADEVEHARLAYGLAAAYAGRPLGPAPLPLADLALATDRRDVITALIDEGCVGETLGAAEAQAIAAAADPTVAAVGDRLAADEARHAALAWRTLRWLLDDADDATHAAAADAFTQAIHRARAADHGDGPHLPAHGLPGPAARKALHADTIAEVIMPCARVLGLMA